MQILLIVLVLIFGSSSALVTDDIKVDEMSSQNARQILIGEVFGYNFPTSRAEIVGRESFEGRKYLTLSTGARFFDNGGDRLFIFHAGHNQDSLSEDVGAPLIRDAMQQGFDVLVLEMPTGDHGRFSDSEHPLSEFMTPIATSLNYVTAVKPYHSITMAGLSGGGWSTVLYAAMDERITKSVPVAGSWPLSLRKKYSSQGGPGTLGDYEQQLPGLSFGYLDLYAMATSSGREQVQIFNDGDPCCFAGLHAFEYLEIVQSSTLKTGGKFDIIVADNDAHTVPLSAFSLTLE